MRLTQMVEALLFASDAPLSILDIARIDERLDEDTVEAVIQQLRAEYEEAERAFQIYEVAGGYQLLTRPDFALYLERYETIPQTTRLSTPGLETLAIIGYRQPIGRAEIEEIRGVGATAALKTLLDRGLVEVTARGEGLGRPLLYGTTSKFLEHFGFRSLNDLPRPEELPIVLRNRAPSSEAIRAAALADGAVTTPVGASEADTTVEVAQVAEAEDSTVAEPVGAIEATAAEPAGETDAEIASAESAADDEGAPDIEIALPA